MKIKIPYDLNSKLYDLSWKPGARGLQKATKDWEGLLRPVDRRDWEGPAGYSRPNPRGRDI